MSYSIRLLFFTILLAACQSKQAETPAENSDSYDSLTEDVQDVNDSNPLNEEHIVSFQEFRAKYIATGMIKLLDLPSKLLQDGLAFTTLDSPEGAFENIPNKNYEVIVRGLLPDTSRYYGIVYDFQMDDYITHAETGVYSTRVATFTKEGKFINRAPVIQVGNFTGASSCGSKDNAMSGYINPDLSFFGIHIFTQDCSMDGNLRPAQLTVNTFGKINDDGTITSSTVETDETSSEDDATRAEKLMINTPELQVTLNRFNSHVQPTPGDLTYFFPLTDLQQSAPYTWYTLYYPTANIPLTTVVRRMMSDGPVRKRQYGFALVNIDGIGVPFSFYWDDSRMIESNEPDVSVLYDHFVLITTTDAAGVTGKSVDENYYLLVITNNNLASVNNLSKEALRIQRNWIFARHGLKFQSPDLITYFSAFDWYNPTRSIVSDEELSYEERLAIDAIKRVEQQ